MNRQPSIDHLEADIENETFVIELDGTLNHLQRKKDSCCRATNQLLSVDRTNIGGVLAPYAFL